MLRRIPLLLALTLLVACAAPPGNPPAGAPTVAPSPTAVPPTATTAPSPTAVPASPTAVPTKPAAATPSPAATKPAAAPAAATKAPAAAVEPGGRTHRVGVTEDKPNDRWGFNPSEITIAIGDTIEFVNDGKEEHDFTAVNGLFESPTVPPGGTYTFTFGQPGRIRYYCTLHDNQEGLVVVLPTGGA